MRAHIDVAAGLRRVVLGVPLLLIAVALYKQGHHTAFYVLALLSAPAIEALARLFESPKRKRVETWPITQAHVESASVSRIGDGEYSYHRGEVAYSYSVDNEYWSGFCARDFDKEEEAWAFVDALKGKTLYANYSPEQHNVSALTDAAILAAIPDPSVLRERRLLRIPALDWFWDLRLPGSKR